MKSVQVILNPYAGRGAGARVKDQLASALQAAGQSFELTETTRQGHALELAASMRAAGCKVIVAAGGDGTVNEVLNGLAQATPEGETVGQLAPCAIGTGNDFADMSGAKRGVDALVQRIVAGQSRLVDMGRGIFTSKASAASVGSGREVIRYFDNNIGLGFEAQVTVDSNRIKRVNGPVRYLVAVFKALNHYQSPNMEVSWKDGEGVWQQRSQVSFMLSMGNSRRTGGLFYITPDALLDDGLLDLAIVPDKSKFEVLQMLPKTFTGAHRSDPRILFVRCTEVKVSCSHPVPVHLDGEVVMDDVTTAHVELFPKRLEIIV